MTLNFLADRVEIEVNPDRGADGKMRLNVIVTADAGQILAAIDYEGGFDLIRQYAREEADDERVEITADCPY